MPGIFLAFLLAAIPHPEASKDVRISLFSLFKPESVTVHVLSQNAELDLDGVAQRIPLHRGEMISLSLSSNGSLVIRGSASSGIRESMRTSSAEVKPGGSSEVELILPRRIRRTFRGGVKVRPEPGFGGKLSIVLTTDREDAVAAIVASETSRRELEALKSLAIVVRTFMLAENGRHSSEGFDFCDTTHCQLYRGELNLNRFDPSSPVFRAVSETRGVCLWFDRRPVDAHYTAVCGGLSATPSLVWGGQEIYPYKRIACRWCAGAQFARWERSARTSDVLRALSRALSVNLSDSTELEIENESSGLVKSVVLIDRGVTRTITTDAFRRAIGSNLGWNTVLSPSFSVERRVSRIIFRGRGFGSQIGLCEAGAFSQAASGKSHHDILEFYFPGTYLSE